ncbi:MAG: metallopeptidase TldD-related protein, partial [Acidobacteria bacterium]|nr:metallopeptidase TldD-related protein [Acidobacteriota bacterium]
TLEDVSLYSIGASLGGLFSPSRNHLRIPQVQLRLGGYSLDNTNFVLSDFFGGRGEEAWPLDNDYNVLRQGWWLATDRTYKASAQVIARKRSALQAMTQNGKLNDFAKAEPFRYTPAFTVRGIDEKPWPERVRRLSAVFLKYPEAASSDVSYASTVSTVRYMNTESSLQRYPDNLDHVRIEAAAIAADGTEIRDGWTVVRTNSVPLPEEQELRAATAQVAENLRQLVKAAPGEDYSGPVLFESVAAAQMFAQLLGSNVGLTRTPVNEPGRTLPLVASELEGRRGSRILPDWVDVNDDPSQETFAGEALVGHYVVDIEGVQAKPVALVEKGVLKNFLLTRQPVTGFEGSNGHARLPGMFGARTARISNLFVKASATVPEAELKKKLIEMCGHRGKPYGMLVRKLDYPSSAGGQEIRRMATAAMRNGGSSRVFSSPLMLYKVFPDGREELVRGLRFRGLPVRALKDLVAASDRPAVFNYLDNGALLAVSGASATVTACSVIAPSVLLDDVDLEHARDEVATPPLVPPPPLPAVP